jgi:uncharacterized protein YwgA
MINASSTEDSRESSVANRLKLQRLAFLAKKFGFDLGYRYSMVGNGPYSHELARDSYAIYCEASISIEKMEGFDKDSFILFFKGRNEKWLDVIAAASDFAEGEAELELNRIIDLTSGVKRDYSREYITSVINEGKDVIFRTK